MRTKFKFFSTDGGKTIKKDDALLLLRALDQNPSKKEFFEALIEANISSHSTFTFDEFELLAKCIWSDEPMEEVLKKAFKKFDKNGDGFIESKEFEEILLNYGEVMTKSEIEEVIKLADLNNDGKIVYNGNLKFFLFLFQFKKR